VDFREHLHEFNNGRNLNALGVFLCIALHADSNGWAWPGRGLLKRETGIGTEHAMTGALAHLRKIRIQGHRVFSHYRVQNPRTKRWGRSAYLIFPDLPHGPGPFANLVEYDPLVGYQQVDKVVDPIVGYPQVDDRHAGNQQQEVKPLKEGEKDDDDGLAAAPSPPLILEDSQVEAYCCLRCQPINMDSDQALKLAKVCDLDAVRGWCCVAWARQGPGGVEKPAGFVWTKLWDKQRNEPRVDVSIPRVAPAQIQEFAKWVADFRTHRLPEEAAQLGLKIG
jgi:hypothetical protein